MNPVSPHQLLSAYLDGELAPAEREEVERLLEESAEARQELRELEKIGELLRQIPRDALPGVFSNQVLDVCLADTGKFERDTLDGNHPEKVAAKRAMPKPRKFRWVNSIGATAALALVGWIVIANLPEPGGDAVPEVASKSKNELHAEEDDEMVQASSASSDRSLPMAPGGRDVPSMNEVQAAQAFDGAKAADSTGQKADDGADAVSGREANRTPSQSQSFDLETGEVAVVKVVVRDRRQGLARLRSVLGDSQDATAQLEEKSFANATADLAVLVEADPALFKAAIRDLENAAGVDRLSRGESIALAKIQPLLGPKQNGFGAADPRKKRGFGASRMRAAGAAGIAPANAVPTKPKDNSPAAPDAKNADNAEPVPRASLAPKAESPKEAKPGKTQFTPAGSGAPKGLLGGDPQSRGRQPEVDAKLTRRAGEVKKPEPGETGATFSKELALPAPLLDQLQKATAKVQAQEAEAGDRESVALRSNDRRVRVLFVFVEEPGPKPAGAKPAPTKSDPPQK